ncbi:hypothetical protein EJ08DRAFT_105575 [Tothia fuscella]|uniref:Uncharacterized protein n=1 Tax=Tothia fuscella TaxID=1048955 RepID=A0A9P4NWM2_9PEZI|nr:hypothetical protein EJ08DRAFT_105575 [Tothia fuscella]
MKLVNPAPFDFPISLFEAFLSKISSMAETDARSGYSSAQSVSDAIFRTERAGKQECNDKRTRAWLNKRNIKAKRIAALQTRFEA